MDNYYPLIIWLLTALVCGVIAHLRHVRATATRQLLVALLGPFAIPLVFFMTPDRPQA